MTTSALASVAPPPSRVSMRQQMLFSVLAKTSPGERHFYDVARRWLAELEGAAPWERLYEWPGRAAELAVMAVALAAAIERLTSQLHWPADSASLGRELSSLESSVARLHLVHSILGHDLERLREHSGRCQAAPDDPDMVLLLQELIGEVKGKYIDAMVGATVALIAGHESDHLLIEQLLFPERGEEARAARAFLKNLREIRQLLDALLQAQPMAGWIGAWQAERRIDRYALVPLTQLRGALGAVLHQDNRRALHLPDFHQLCRREAVLSDTVGAIESLHRATWSEPAVPAETYGALVWRTLELAAILDVENLLKELIDGDLVDRLRRMDRPDPNLVAADPLRRLVREDDLRTVIDLLRGSMRKRGSLQLRPPVAPARPHSVESVPRRVAEPVAARG